MHSWREGKRKGNEKKQEIKKEKGKSNEKREKRSKKKRKKKEEKGKCLRASHSRHTNVNSVSLVAGAQLPYPQQQLNDFVGYGEQ